MCGRLPTDSLHGGVVSIAQQHEVAGLDITVQNLVRVALRQRAQYSTHVAGHLGWQYGCTSGKHRPNDDICIAVDQNHASRM